MTFTELIQQVAEERNEKGSLDTNQERLVRDLWKLAIGWTDKIVKPGEIVQTYHPPVKWAAQLVVELVQTDGSEDQDKATHELLKDLKKLVEANKLNDEFLE